MTDLDAKLRDVAHRLVADAPPPPDIEAHAVPMKRSRVLVATGAAVAAVLVAGLAVRVLASDERSTLSVGDDAQSDTRSAADTNVMSCSSEPPVNVLVPSATTGPIAAPVPGRAAALPGQRVVHWSARDATVELRWPAGPQPDYAPAGVAVVKANAAEHVEPARVEVDVEPLSSGRERVPGAFDPDLVLEAQPAGAVPPAPCDTMEVAVETIAGRWTTALRARPIDERIAPPYEAYDNAPLVGARAKVVDPPPVVPCEGAGRPGVADYKSGAGERLSKTAPIDVLRHYLANSSGAPRSNWVEMAISESRVIYGAQSDAGWTVLVEATGDTEGWHLGGWRSSGC